jgi:hypothetical protein
MIMGVRTDANPSDILTKFLPEPTHMRHASSLNISFSATPQTQLPTTPQTTIPSQATTPVYTQNGNQLHSGAPSRQSPHINAHLTARPLVRKRWLMKKHPRRPRVRLYHKCPKVGVCRSTIPSVYTSKRKIKQDRQRFWETIQTSPYRMN